MISYGRVGEGEESRGGRGGTSYALPYLLDRFVRVCGTEVVFGEVYGDGFAVLEAHHGVLPVTDVVAEADVEHDVAEVVAVEEEPEGVDYAIAFVHCDENCRSVAASALGLRVGWRRLASLDA